jgi:two-component system response regulator PilR (NtrC family)
MARLLIVDDDLSLREFLTLFLRKEGHEVEVATNGERALDMLEQAPFELVLTDIRMPRMGGLELLENIKSRGLATQVVVMTAFSTTDTALEAMRKGAYDYIVKPFQLAEVKLVLSKCLEKSKLIAENQQLKKELERGKESPKRPVIYVSKAMDDVMAMVRRVARTPSSVLILGESGTGKELIARMLHEASDRASKPFVALNCGAIPEALMESELFGHVKGSFTGATRDKKGLFEAAAGGTIFLDEIGDLTLNLQVKLLRVLQERVVTPIGESKEVPVDVRVVAATHRTLRDMVQEGRFRADLYFRLNVIEVGLPALRERREDILPLAQHFLTDFGRKMGRQFKGFEPEALAVLQRLPYPGNVRELENVIERAVALEPSDRISATWLPDPGGASFLETKPTGQRGKQDDDPTQRPADHVQRAVLAVDGWMQRCNAPIDIEKLLETLERGLLESALRQTGGNKTEAARLLSLTFRSLRYKLAKFGDLE